MSSLNAASTNKDHIRAHRRKGRENIFLDCRKFLMITISIDIRLDSVVSIAMLPLAAGGLGVKMSTGCAVTFNHKLCTSYLEMLFI